MSINEIIIIFYLKFFHNIISIGSLDGLLGYHLDNLALIISYFSFK